MKHENTIVVHDLHTREAAAILAKHRITPADLVEILNRHRDQDNAIISVVIGISTRGIVYSESVNWTDNTPGFSEGIVTITWSTAQDLLGNLKHCHH